MKIPFFSGAHAMMSSVKRDEVRMLAIASTSAGRKYAPSPVRAKELGHPPEPTCALLGDRLARWLPGDPPIPPYADVLAIPYPHTMPFFSSSSPYCMACHVEEAFPEKTVSSRRPSG